MVGYDHSGGVGMNRDMLQDQIHKLEEEISRLPLGKVTYKTINGKKQPYLQWTENGKQHTKYIRKDVRAETLAGASRRAGLESELNNLKT